MPRKRILLLVMILSLAGCGGKSAEQLYTEGIKELQKANPRGAIVLLKNALEKDQNHLEARFHLAKAYAETGKFEQAEKEFQKVLRQNPSRSEVKLELAKVHCALKKSDLAIREVRDYLESHPQAPEALEILGVAHFSAGNAAEAERCLQQAIKAAPSRILARLELADMYRAQGRKEEAKDLVNKIIAQDPKNTRAYTMRAFIEISEGDREKALETYRKMTELKPSDPLPLYKSGLIYIDKGELERAAGIAEDLTKKFPKYSEGYRLKGIVAYHRKNVTDAITELQYSIKIRPTTEGYYFLGLSLYSRGELESALSQFRLILDHNPNFVQARLLTGMILLSQKRIDDAMTEIKKAIQIDPGNAMAHNLLGSAYLTRGMGEEGLRELNLATQLDPKIVDAYYKKGMIHLRKGNAKEAETDLRTAVKVRPELLNSRLILFAHYLRTNERAKALAVLREGLTGTKDDAVLYNSMAATMFADNKPADAVKLLQKAKESNPAFLAPYFNLATHYAATGNHDKALGEYGEVLRRVPQNLKALLGTAILYELTGKDSEGLKWYTRAKESGNPTAFIALAGYHLRKKDSSKAVSVLDEALKSTTRKAELLEMKGRIFMAEKKFTEAIKAFDDLEAVMPDRGIPLKIKAYLAMNEVPKAVEQTRRVITLKPNSAIGYLMLAAIYEGQHDLNRAVEQVKLGLNRDKGNPQAMLMLGTLYAKKKDYTLASTTFAELVRKNPDLIPAHFSQGTLLEMTGNKKEAVRKYRQILAKSENYVPALNNLAYLCAEGYGSKEEGLRMALTAFKLEPGNGGVVDTLGYLLLKNGRTADALKTLEKAVAMLSDNPTVNYHLALAYRESGDKKQAVASLQKALRSGDFPELKAAQTLLAQM